MEKITGKHLWDIDPNEELKPTSKETFEMFLKLSEGYSPQLPVKEKKKTIDF